MIVTFLLLNKCFSDTFSSVVSTHAYNEHTLDQFEKSFPKKEKNKWYPFYTTYTDKFKRCKETENLYMKLLNAQYEIKKLKKRQKTLKEKQKDILKNKHKLIKSLEEKIEKEKNREKDRENFLSKYKNYFDTERDDKTLLAILEKLNKLNEQKQELIFEKEKILTQLRKLKEILAYKNERKLEDSQIQKEISERKKQLIKIKEQIKKKEKETKAFKQDLIPRKNETEVIFKKAMDEFKTVLKKEEVINLERQKTIKEVENLELDHKENLKDLNKTFKLQQNKTKEAKKYKNNLDECLKQLKQLFDEEFGETPMEKVEVLLEIFLLNRQLIALEQNN